MLEFSTGRGWLVLFPQRRGRGKSEGRYAEGLAEGGCGYSCDPRIARRGFDRALEDLDAILAHVKTRNDVDLSKSVIGGISRGGILAIAHAGMRPTEYSGAINFSGGWMGKACSAYEAVNIPLFTLGAASKISSLWLYGNKDPYYPVSHCRSNFDNFTSVGGKGTFVAVAGGHCLIFKPQLWTDVVDSYLLKIA